MSALPASTAAPDLLQWGANAECSRPGANPRWWSAGDPGSDTAKAKSWCARCQVRTDCLEEAMRREGAAKAADRQGVWGGLTPGERRRLHLKRRRLAQVRRDETEGGQG